MGDFELDTAVEGEGGRYRATLSRDWEIWGPNGGYLAAVALRAAGATARIPRPASLYVHYLGVADFGEVELAVTPVKVGRRSESLRVSMSQRERPVLEALVRTTAEGPALEHAAARCPAVPAPETLENVEQIVERKRLEGGPRFAFWNNLEERPLDPEEGPLTRASAPEFRGWLRFRPRSTFDDPWTDAGRYAVLIDTLSWPAAWRAHVGTELTAPSLDCMVWFHRPAPEVDWLLADHVSPIARDARIGTEGRVWSPAGELIASGGSQLYCVAPRS